MIGGKDGRTRYYDNDDDNNNAEKQHKYPDNGIRGKTLIPSSLLPLDYLLCLPTETEPTFPLYGLLTLFLSK